MKVCKKCKYFKFIENGRYQVEQYRCIKTPPNMPVIDVVTGEEIRYNQSCHYLREQNHLCGKEGNWWTPNDDKTL